MSTENAELVRAIIAGGESYYAELKGCWSYGPDGKKPRDLKETAADVETEVVAFANSEGGDLLVGVEDDGAVTGVPWDEDRIRYLVNVPSSSIKGSVSCRVRTVELDGHVVIWFRVEETTDEVVTSDGRCLWRKATSTEPVPPGMIRQKRRKLRGDVRYESEPVPAATVDDLDEGLLMGAASQGLPRNFSFKGISSILRYWNLVEARNGDVVLRRAALLLFAKEPLQWHPNNRIRIRRIRGDEPGYGRELRTREKVVGGPICRLLPESNRLLSDELSIERRQNRLFTVSQLLPAEAVEECIVNAVAHRNYAIEGQAIEILMYPDRVEVRSPGGVPEPISIKDLLRDLESKRPKHLHRSRNPLIMRVLRDVGWARDQGEGLPRIFGAMRQVELHLPELEEDADTFIVRLSTRSLYDEATRAWIAAYGPFGLRPEDRRYLVEIRQAGGRLSVDKLARAVGESYDSTKQHLVRLESQGMVWHRPGSRTYTVVEAANVPHERAWRAFEKAGIEPSDGLTLKRDDLRRIFGYDDVRTLEDLITRWKQAGILTPAGSGRWKPGRSFLVYLQNRGN